MLDAHGCELRCSVMSDASQENQFIVARKEVSVHNLFYIHLLCQDLWSYPVGRCHAARQETLGLILMENSTMYKLLIKGVVYFSLLKSVLVAGTLFLSN